MKLEDYQRKYKNNKENGWTLERYQTYEEFVAKNPRPMKFMKEYWEWYDRLAAYMEKLGFRDV
jgi:hypothetical protein